MSEAASTSRPSVTLKLATSLDGRIALGNGQSKWITGEAARAEVHRLRAAHDAVIVGSETVLTDDPELTARTDPMPEKQPLRVVADSRGRVPASAKLFSTLEIGPSAFTSCKACRSSRRKLRWARWRVGCRSRPRPQEGSEVVHGPAR